MWEGDKRKLYRWARSTPTAPQLMNHTRWQLSLTTQILLLSLSTQFSTFSQCFTLASVLNLCSSLALSLTSLTDSLIMFSLLSRLSSLILSSILSCCCYHSSLYFRQGLYHVTRKTVGRERKRKPSKAVDNHTRQAQQHTLRERNRNRLLCFFLTGLFLDYHILIQIPVILRPYTG